MVHLNQVYLRIHLRRELWFSNKVIQPFRYSAVWQLQTNTRCISHNWIQMKIENKSGVPFLGKYKWKYKYEYKYKYYVSDKTQVRLCGDQLVGMLRMICQHHRWASLSNIADSKFSNSNIADSNSSNSNTFSYATHMIFHKYLMTYNSNSKIMLLKYISMTYWSVLNKCDLPTARVLLQLDVPIIDRISRKN